MRRAIGRLADDGGISLVETMVALMIFTVAVFALLGGLIASAASVMDQQLRADATRVATQTLEASRSEDFDALAIGTQTQVVTTGNGRDLTLERTVAWQDANDPSGSSEDVKVVTATVSWTDRGRDREVVYTTAISPEDPALVGEQILHVSVDPGAVEVDENGVPVAEITVLASPENFSYLGDMTARWTRKDGTLASVQMSQVPDTNTWSAVMPPEDVTWPMDPEASVDIDIEVVAGTRSGQTVLTLHRPPDTAPGPTLSDGVVSPDPILLSTPPGGSNNCSGDRCKNVDEVTFQVTVTPFDDTQVIERVFVEYDLRDATSPTPHDLADSGDGLTWTASVPSVYDDPSGAVQFAPGSSQPFNFYAVYDGGQLSAPLTVTVEVVHE